MNFKIVTYKPVNASKYSLMDDLRSARTPMTSKFTSLGSFCAFINLVNSQIDQSASDYKGEKRVPMGENLWSRRVQKVIVFAATLYFIIDGILSSLRTGCIKSKLPVSLSDVGLIRGTPFKTT